MDSQGFHAGVYFGGLWEKLEHLFERAARYAARENAVTLPHTGDHSHQRIYVDIFDPNHPGNNGMGASWITYRDDEILIMPEPGEEVSQLYYDFKKPSGTWAEFRGIIDRKNRILAMKIVPKIDDHDHGSSMRKVRHTHLFEQIVEINQLQ